MNENSYRIHPLTKKQTIFASEQYHIVSEHLHTHGTNTDDYHDAVILSYLNAVQQYDEHPSLQSESFEVVAKRFMDIAIEKYQHRQMRKRAQRMPSMQVGMRYGY